MPTDLPRDLPGLKAFVEEQLAVCAAATEGPWEAHPGIEKDNWGVLTELFPIEPGITQAISSKANADFIVAARDHYAALLTSLLALAEENERLRAALNPPPNETA